MADGEKLYGEVTLDALKSKSVLATDADGVIIDGSGIDTTFVDADGNTITVTKGIITAKVAP